LQNQPAGSRLSYQFEDDKLCVAEKKFEPLTRPALGPKCQVRGCHACHPGGFPSQVIMGKVFTGMTTKMTTGRMRLDTDYRPSRGRSLRMLSRSGMSWFFLTGVSRSYPARRKRSSLPSRTT